MDKPVPWWLRAYLLFAAFQGWALGGTGLVTPDEIQIPLRMTPLNERFVAALYLAGGIGVLLAAFSRRRGEARIFVLGFAFAITVILVQILLRWNDYMADSLPHRPAFLGAYVLDFIFSVVVVPAAGYLVVPPRVRHARTVLFLIESVVLAVVGLALLLVPVLAAQVWPWALPPVLSQLYAAFFLSVALGAFLAAGDSSEVAIRTFTVTTLALTVLILVASLLHLSRFKPEPVTPIWFASFLAGAVLFAVAFFRDAIGRAGRFGSADRVGG